MLGEDTDRHGRPRRRRPPRRARRQRVPRAGRRRRRGRAGDRAPRSRWRRCTIRRACSESANCACCCRTCRTSRSSTPPSTRPCRQTPTPTPSRPTSPSDLTPQVRLPRHELPLRDAPVRPSSSGSPSTRPTSSSATSATAPRWRRSAVDASVDTTMGLTPLQGLVMGTRSGDIDPAVVMHLVRVAGLTLDQVDAVLNKESGLKGLAGSQDMREVRALADGGRRGRAAWRSPCTRTASAPTWAPTSRSCRASGPSSSPRASASTTPTCGRRSARRWPTWASGSMSASTRAPGTDARAIDDGTGADPHPRGADERGGGDRAPVGRGGRPRRFPSALDDPEAPVDGAQGRGRPPVRAAGDPHEGRNQEACARSSRR